MENTICKHCKRLFSEKYKPILFPCGHTLCEKCLSKIMYAESSFFCPFDRQFLKLKQCRLNIRLLNLAEKFNKEQKQDLNSTKNFERKDHKTLTTTNINIDTLEINKDQEQSHNETLSTINTSGIFLTPKSEKQSRYLATPKFDRTTMSINRGNINKKRQAEGQKAYKNRHKSRKTDDKNTINASFSLTNAALLTASIIGGMFLYSKVATPSMKSAKSAGSIFSTVKEVSGYSARSIVKLIKHS